MPKKKKIDYHIVLRDIAKSMARLKRPERLLKIITRYIDKELGLTHTSILVYDKQRHRFKFFDSKGTRKVPVGLVKFDMDHPLVTWFRETKGNELRNEDYLSMKQLRKGLMNGRLKLLNPERRKVFEDVRKAMDNLRVELAIPGYFKDKLIGLLLLGPKKDHAPFHNSDISFFQTLTQDCSMAVMTAEYQRSLLEKNEELAHQLQEIEKLREKEQKTYYEIMRSLAQEVHAKDPYTFGHINQVERLGIMTAKELGMDLTGRGKDILSAGLILHDVGKIGIPDHILKKPARLTEEEWLIMRTHVDKGARILEPLTDFREVAEIVRCHHENYDGSGYPRGLKGDEIPLESRIVSVVDAFHAIVSTRCYSQGRPIEIAFDELERCAGSQFDPKVVEAFVRSLKREMKKRGVGFFIDDHLPQENPTDERAAS